jgi:hypothetical protein
MFILQQVDEVFGHRGFTSTPDGQVADANDRDIKLPGFE